MHYKPCRWCPCCHNGKDCERLQAVKLQLKGLSLNAVSLRCLDYKKLYRKGQRLHIETNGYYHEAATYDEPEHGREALDSDATFTGWKGWRMMLHLDERDGKRGAFIKLYPYKRTPEDFEITEIDESDVEICDGCGTPVTAHRSKEFVCMNDISEFGEGVPTGCKAKAPIKSDTLPNRRLALNRR